VSGTSSVKRVAGVVGDSMSPQAQKTRATVEAKSKKGYFYKPLPGQFRRNGFQVRQIAREGDAAIYEQTWSDVLNQVPLTKSFAFAAEGDFKSAADLSNLLKSIQLRSFGVWTDSRSPTATRLGPSFLKYRWKNQQQQGWR
jgi:hypothetical protein